MAAEQQEAPQGVKRPHDEVDGTTATDEPKQDGGDDPSSDDDDDDMGPALPSAAEAAEAPKKKKRRKLAHEKQYVAALPSSSRYFKSLMHKDQLAFCTFTPHTDFLITSSIDGYVKFWKKVTGGVEFVKEYRAHAGEITSVTCSADGQSFATAGADGTIKLFDVATFDLLSMLSVEARSICFVHGKHSSIPMLAVSSISDGTVKLFDGRGEKEEPQHTLTKLHRKPVHLMAYNAVFDCVISADESGMVEYWQPSGNFEKPDDVFEMKSSTSLFEFKKAKSVPSTISISPNGRYFATMSFPDRKIRIFDFTSGKLYRTSDESIDTITEMQQAGTLSSDPLDTTDFTRRINIEKELENPITQPRMNIIWDESGNFVLYGSILGVKVLNHVTNTVIRTYGREEPFRPLNLTLYQGQPSKKGVVTIDMAASANPLLQEAEARDTMLIATGNTKPRFYMYSNETHITKDRDIHNEKPTTKTPKTPADLEAEKASRLPTTATLHTTKGDIHLRLFASQTPLTVENFTTHARQNYYNTHLFHRVIRKFMIQTGDPLGDGTGGESIWGKEFADEFHPDLKHDKPYTLSMANAGPGTNASQFFITTERAPWLDGKHTVFGRVVRGMEVVHAIENVRVVKERPAEDVRVVSISVG
ncbi:hypothetical protein MBLNU230_g0416t1 [Neophaeotheca triangularis]